MMVTPRESVATKFSLVTLRGRSTVRRLVRMNVVSNPSVLRFTPSCRSSSPPCRQVWPTSRTDPAGVSGGRARVGVVVVGVEVAGVDVVLVDEVEEVDVDDSGANVTEGESAFPGVWAVGA